MALVFEDSLRINFAKEVWSSLLTLGDEQWLYYLELYRDGESFILPSFISYSILVLDMIDLTLRDGTFVFFL